MKRQCRISKHIPHICNKAGIWMVRLQLLTIAMGKGYRQQMSPMWMRTWELKAPNPMHWPMPANATLPIYWRHHGILNDANVDQKLSNIIEAYLLAQGRRMMNDCIPSLSPYNHVATVINNLGWDCFVEGRILHVLIDTVKPMLHWYIPRGSVELWGARFIKSLLSITHKQWLYRNSDAHHVINGLSSRQHQELTARIHDFLETKKDSLLERHKHLMDVDFVKVGSGTTIARQVWVANVEMVISVAKVARNNFCTQEILILLLTPLLKTSTHLRNKEVHFHTPSMDTGTPTLKQPRNTTLCHSACYPHLYKSLYCFSRTHRPPFPLSKQQSLLPARIHKPRDAMNKILWQVFPTATPTTDLRPYDKICAHLHRLHNRIKALVNRDWSVLIAYLFGCIRNYMMLFTSPWCGCSVPWRKRKTKYCLPNNQIDTGNLLSNILTFAPEIIYIKGIHNTVADAISWLEYDPKLNSTNEYNHATHARSANEEANQKWLMHSKFWSRYLGRR